MTSQRILDTAVDYYDNECSWWDDFYEEKSKYGDDGDDSIYLHEDGGVY